MYGKKSISATKNIRRKIKESKCNVQQSLCNEDLMHNGRQESSFVVVNTIQLFTIIGVNVEIYLSKMAALKTG